MADHLTIRWTSAARVAAVGLAAIAALWFLAGALEPAAPPPLPPDVGLVPTVSEPAVPLPAGEERAGAGRSLPRVAEPEGPRRPRADPDGRRAAPRRPSKPRTDEELKEDRSEAAATPSPSVASPAPSPQPVAYAPPPAPPAPAPPPPRDAAEPIPSEFGFER